MRQSATPSEATVDTAPNGVQASPPAPDVEVGDGLPTDPGCVAEDVDAEGVPAVGLQALERTVARLRADNDGLRTALRHRAVIEQAKGVLMARNGCTPDQAFERLVDHSQRSNQKLIRVAAAVVAATITARHPVATGGEFDLDLLEDAAPQGEPLDARDADRRLAGVALEAALDLDELVHIVAYEAAAQLAPNAVLLAAIEPDGAVRLIAGTGYDQQMMSAWHRIPPSVDVPLVAAARTHTPVLLEDFNTRAERFPLSRSMPRVFEAQASVPLKVGDRTVGVLGMSWLEPRRFDEGDAARLVEVADQTVGPFLRLLRGDDAELPQVAVDVLHTRWFRAALDAVVVPLFVLFPVRDQRGTVVDFTIAFLNRTACEGETAPADQIVGHTVLELYPRTASRVLFTTFLDVLETGRTVHLDRVTAQELVDGTEEEHDYCAAAARLGDGLLVTWRRLDD
ncbi:ANTAR domain-containing protein [Egicoccus sp. AB-alg2]|uniref:ANTAR domain-containing protein n=1 Tax=Egicoccus sp. AB-alg2 TaxID=3242693 RepID=UPI00359CCC77